MNESTQLTRPGVVSTGNEQTTLERPERNGGDATAHVSYAYDNEDKQGVHLLDYWRIVRKHIWLILGISVVIPTLVAIYLIRKPDIYAAQARIQVDLENANPLLGGMSKGSSVILNSESNDPAYFNTQLQILTGPGLLRSVAKNLDLEHNQDFLRNYPAKGQSMWSNLQSRLGLRSNTDSRPSASDALPITSSSSTTAQDLEEAERLSDYVDDLQQTLGVEPVKETRLTVRETRLIDISYQLTEPRLARTNAHSSTPEACFAGAQPFGSNSLERSTAFLIPLSPHDPDP